MSTPKQVVRPALNVHAQGGQIVFVDPDTGTPKQTIGKQDDGTIAVVEVNGDPTPAPSAPVVGPIAYGLVATWDGLLAGDTQGPQLLANGDFEAGVDPWTAGGATVAQSAVQVHGGASSALVTPVGIENGVPTAGLSSEQVQVTPGQTYKLDCWVWLTTAVTLGFDLAVDWYSVDPDTGVQALIETWDAAQSAAAGAWVHLSASVFTAPANAVFAVVRPTLTAGSGTGGPAATDLWYLDDVTFAQVVNDVPANFDHVAVHVSTVDGFTPDGSTLAGTLNHSGAFPITDLTAGTEYFVRLVAVNTSGIAGGVSAQASGVPTATVIGAGQITETEIADDSISTPKLQANAVTTAKIAANQIVAGLIAAEAITADKLAATLVLASQIIAGTADGARVQIDAGGINAYNDQGDNTVQINADGSATFTGSSVSTNSLKSQVVQLTSQGNGGLRMYDAGTITPLNSNRDFASGISPWTVGGHGSAAWNNVDPSLQYQGHGTLQATSLGPSGDAIFAASENVPVVAGRYYTLFAVVQIMNSTTALYPEITWFGSGGAVVGRSGGAAITGADPVGEWVPIQVTAPCPAGATQARIRIGFTAPVEAGLYFNVGFAELYESSSGLLATTLANVAGTDPLGGAYPAGLSTSTVTARKVTADNLPENFKRGQVSATTDSGGDITVNHGATFVPAAVVCFPATAVSGYCYSVYQITATTFTVRVQGGASTARGGFLAVSSQPVTFNWLAFG